MKKYILSERVNLFEPNVYISFVVKLDRKVDVKLIKNAINNAYKANEATMSKVVIEENGMAYYEKLTKSNCSIFEAKGDYKDIIKDSQKEPFKIEKGEMIRSYIIEEEESTTLLIMVHHLVGDGKSIVIFTDDIIKSLDNIKLSYKPLEIITKELLDKKVKLKIYEKFAANYLNKKWNKNKQVFTYKDYYKVHEAYYKTHNTNLKVLSFDESEIKKECHKLNVTLNSYFIQKLQNEMFNDCKVIGIPVSIRNGSTSMSNLTSGIKVINNNKNVVNLHKSIKKLLLDDNKRYFPLMFISELDMSLIDSVLLYVNGIYDSKISKIAANIMLYEGKKKTELGVTNIGVIDIEREHKDFNIKDMLFFPPKVSYANNIVGISTFHGKINVTIVE